MENPLEEPGVRANPMTRSLRWATARTHELTAERFTILLGVALCATGILASGAAALGLFRVLAPVVLLAWAIAAGLAVWMLDKRTLRLRGDRYDVAALVLAGLAALSAALRPHLYFAGQTDIGFYISDAVIIATTGGRTLDGAHDVLLPGFTAVDSGGVHISAMFGYSALAALWAYVGGFFLVSWVNAPLVFVTSMSLYHLARRVGAREGAVLAILLYNGLVLTVWFGRWVMSENAATFAFWLAVLLTLPLLRRWGWKTAAALVVVLVYGSLVRPEGVLVAAWFVLVLLVAHGRAAWAFIQTSGMRAARNRTITIGLAAAIVLGVFLAVSGALPTGYLLRSRWIFENVLRGQIGTDAFDVPTSGPHPNWGDYWMRYQWDSVMQYGLHWLLLVAIVGVLLGIIARKEYGRLVLLCVPYALFILMPPVTTGHPFYMRRLWIAWIPLLCLLASVTLDPRLVASRWPRSDARTGRERPRFALQLAALAIIAFILIPVLTTAQPIWMRSESDGTKAFVDAIPNMVPSDANLIFDEDVIGYATPTRLIHGHTVVPLFDKIPAAMFEALSLPSTSPSYLLRFSTTLGIAVAGTDTNGTVAQDEVRLDVRYSPRYNLRNYISAPPLEQGYAPLQTYLDGNVPATRWADSQYLVDVVRLADPVVLLKNIGVAEGQWARGPRGMEATTNGSPLTIDHGLFTAQARQELQLALYVYYVQTETRTWSLQWTDGNNTTELPASLESDGSSTLRLGVVKLPVPMEARAILFPAGFQLRGAYMGVLQ